MTKLYARALRQYRTAQLMKKLGYVSRACELFTESAGLFLRSGAGGWLPAVRVYNELGRQSLENCEYPAAFRAGQRAGKILEDRPGEPGSLEQVSLRIQTWSLMGEVALQTARYDQAEAYFQRTLASAVENFGQDHELTAQARIQLGILYKYTGHFDLAHQLYQTALSSLLPRTGPNHPLVAALYHNLGGLAHASGDVTSAEASARTAWDIDRHLFGSDHPTSLADAAAYAVILDGLGRPAESVPIYRHVLALYEKIYRPGHYEIAAVLNNLAGAWYALGKVEEAEALFRQSLALQEQLLGSDHPESALTANNLGSLLNDSGHPAEGRRLIERALAVFQLKLGENHPYTNLARDNLAYILD